MPFFQLKQKVAENIATILNHETAQADGILGEFSQPPKIELGHLAFPCFRLAKALGKPPGKIAQEIQAKWTDPACTATAAGPYVNFRWDGKALYKITVPTVLAQKSDYGKDTSGAGKTIVLEYCSPNMAKRLAFQHIRSTLIGNTLANIYTFLGYDVKRANFIGDWGTQFARLLSAVEQWGDPSQYKNPTDPQGAMNQLLELYVRFHKELDQNPSQLDAANRALQRLEEGETKARDTWENIRKISIAAMNETLTRLKAKFDFTEGESHYIPAIQGTIDDLKKKGITEMSDGALVVFVEGTEVPALIVKRDGTTLYLTRDIAAAMDRWNRFHFEKSLYVVSEQQKLHFVQLFGVLKKMGFPWADRCEHLSFGTVLFGSEKMSTREGRVILLDDILDEAKKLALEECTKKNPGLANKDEVAEMVGIGAIIFGELSANRQRDIEFDWKAILAFDGETGPYVQYANVRCHSLIQKAAFTPRAGFDIAAIGEYAFAGDEESLILTLAKFRATLEHAVRENEPHHLTRYLIEVAKTFSRFYYHFPVLQATDANLREMRLHLVAATRQVLESGLDLLGISCPKEM